MNGSRPSRCAWLAACALALTAIAGSANAAEPPLAPLTLPATPAPQAARLAPLEQSAVLDLARVTAVFDVRPGETLQRAFERWCQAAGWTLVWQSAQDYRLEAAIQFPRGTNFNDAVRDTMRSVWRQQPTVKSSLYRNRVLVVTEVSG